MITTTTAPSSFFTSLHPFFLNHGYSLEKYIEESYKYIDSLNNICVLPFINTLIHLTTFVSYLLSKIIIIIVAILIQRKTAMIDPIIIPTDGMGCGSSSFTEKYSIKQLCEPFVQNVGQQGFRQGCIQLVPPPSPKEKIFIYYFFTKKNFVFVFV